MKKMFITLLLSGVFSIALAQNTDPAALQARVAALESTNAKLSAQLRAEQKAVADLTLQLNSATSNIMLLRESVGNTKSTLEEVTGTFEKRISDNEKSLDTEVNQLVKSIMNNTIYWVIAFLVVGFVTFYLYRKTRGRLSREKAAIYEEIKTGNDNLKLEVAGWITKNADDLKFMFTGEMKDYADKNRKSLEALQSEIAAKLEKLETEIKSAKAKPKKLPNTPVS